MAKITVIGSFVMDMVASVEVFPWAGQTVLGSELHLYPGGKGANQAVAARRLGGDVEMIGCVGDDENGRTFLRLLEEEGIFSEHVRVCRGVPTAVAQVQINRSRENKIVVIPAANHAFTAEDVRALEPILRRTDLVVMQLELPRETSFELLRLCARLRKPLILNPAPAFPLPNELLACASYVTPNETELEILSGRPVRTEGDAFAAADVLLEAGVRAVVATLGRRGALIADAAGKRIVGGFPVEAVDTVAAGDSFNAALAKCLAERRPLDESVRYANAVGALTVTGRGAIPSLPTAARVEAFLRERGVRP